MNWNSGQAEFFQDVPAAGCVTKRLPGGTWGLGGRCVRWSYEHLILGGIGLLLLLILAYAVGVERGRWRPAALGARPPAVASRAPARVAAPAKVVPAPAAVARGPNAEPSRGGAATLAGPYTIQVLTYRQEALAREAAQRLQRTGFATFLIPVGELHQVCVGSYATKRDAERTLHELRKTYKDCYIRAL